MSEKNIVDFCKNILNNKGINWEITVLIVICIIIVAVVGIILTKFKKIKKTIQENYVEFKSYVQSLSIMHKIIVLMIIVAFIVSIIVIVYCVKSPKPYQEIALINRNGKITYPIGVDILNEKKVGKYTFFLYYISEKKDNEDIRYPVLYKWEKGKTAERISKGACPHFEIEKNSIIYLNSTIVDLSHGELYVARPDGKNKRIMEQEIYDFSVDNGYIYFKYCFDNVGAGLKGHALQRMDINGDNVIIASYELSSPFLHENQHKFNVKNGWVVYSNYKVKIGNPADGLEKVVLLDDTNSDWIYYTTNRLIKAKPDGSQKEILDSEDDYWYQIDKIQDGKIYYQKGDKKYIMNLNKKKNK